MRVRTTNITVGLCLPFLTASATANGGEASLLAAAAPVERVAQIRRDATHVPAVATVALLSERVAFVARARDGSPAGSVSSATLSAASNEAPSEPHPAMMLLSMAALIAYVIGRRGVLHG